MQMEKREIAEALRDIQWLQDQVEWRRLTALITRQIEVRRQLLARRISTPEEQAQHNVFVGEVAGLNFLLQAPALAIETLTQGIQKTLDP